MKKLISILFAVLIITALTVTAFASDLPSWYPKDVHAERFHGSNLPHVVDYADVFTDAEEAELTKQINEYIEKYGYDLVIVTDVSNYGLGPYEEQYADDFYYYNGYGTDSEYSGSVIYLNMDPSNRYVSNVGDGKMKKYYTDDNVNKMQDQTYPYLSEGKYAKAMSVNIELIDELTSTGRIATKRSVGDYVFYGCIAAVIGLIAGTINKSSKVRNMKKVAYAKYANDYIVRNSFILRNKNSMFLYKNVTRTYIPPSSSGGSRSGGSSYHGGMHSSGGGGSFSGGSRHF